MKQERRWRIGVFSKYGYPCLGFYTVLGALKQDLGEFFEIKKLYKWFLVCVLLGCFYNFSFDPYYEPHYCGS